MTVKSIYHLCSDPTAFTRTSLKGETVKQYFCDLSSVERWRKADGDKPGNSGRTLSQEAAFLLTWFTMTSSKRWSESRHATRARGFVKAGLSALHRYDHRPAEAAGCGQTVFHL